MITRINPGPRLSEAAVYNGIAWLAGQVGEGASVAEQTADCLAQIDRVLAQVGSSKEHILQAVIWLADVTDYNEMNSVWDKWVPVGHAPARATGEARLAAAKYRVEIIVTAAVPAPREPSDR